LPHERRNTAAAAAQSREGGIRRCDLDRDGRRAVLCGVCCVLPLALPAVALATSGSIIAWFAHAYPWARIAAIIIVTLAWLWVGVRSVSAKAWPPAPWSSRSCDHASSRS
jgi:hypothetical protein